MNTGRLAARVALASLLLVAFGAATRANPAPVRVVYIGQRMLQVMPYGRPLGSVILIPGGSTHPQIEPLGAIGTLSGNFLMAQHMRFVASGYAVGIVERPEDLRKAIAAMRLFGGRPIFVIGHSNGTVPAANAGGLASGGPDGIVLLSSVVVTSPPLTTNVLDYPLEHIVIPVLLVRNKHDSCPYTLPSGMDAISKRLTMSDFSTITMSSTKLIGSPCQSEAPHSYYGIEAQTIAKIVAWLKAYKAK